MKASKFQNLSAMLAGVFLELVMKTTYCQWIITSAPVLGFGRRSQKRPLLMSFTWASHIAASMLMGCKTLANQYMHISGIFRLWTTKYASLMHILAGQAVHTMPVFLRIVPSLKQIRAVCSLQTSSWLVTVHAQWKWLIPPFKENQYNYQITMPNYKKNNMRTPVVSSREILTDEQTDTWTDRQMSENPSLDKLLT